MRINLPVTQREYPFPERNTLVSVTDLKGRIVYCNPAFVAMSGYRQEELQGQPHNLIRHPDMPEEAFRDLWDTVRQGLPWSGTVKNRRKDGDHYWVQANVAPMMDGDRITGYLSVRTAATADDVRAADVLYARLRDEHQSGRSTLALRRGRVQRTDWWGRVRQALRPGLRSGLGTIQAVAGMICVGAGALLWPLGPLGMASALLLAVALALSSTWIAVTWMLAPLKPILHDANRLAAGDLSHPIECNRDGVIGHLQRALSQISVSLRAVVLDARTEVENVRGAVQEIAAGNQDLSLRTESQASGLERTAASMEQIKDTVQQSAASAQQGAQLAQGTAAIAQRSHEAVHAVGQSMNAIDESSQRIQEIVHVIEGVAFQTNILALNAAVEAARAGEAGRGFAVVAAEVRALSQRTGNAAREIKQLIEESNARVATGTTQSGQAQARMAEALDAVVQVSALLVDISGASAGQQTDITEVNQAVTDLEAITQQNAAMVEQLAASAQSLSSQIGTVATSMRLFRLAPGERTVAEEDAVALRRAATQQHTHTQQGFDLSQAVAAHAQWKTTLRNAALREEPLDAQRLRRDDCCPLGQWLHGEGQKQWGSRPAFRALLDRHRAFHHAAGNVADTVNRGEYAQAQTMLQAGTAFSAATQAVIHEIHQLRSEIGAGAQPSGAARPTVDHRALDAVA